MLDFVVEKQSTEKFIWVSKLYVNIKMQLEWEIFLELKWNWL